MVRDYSDDFDFSVENILPRYRQFLLDE